MHAYTAIPVMPPLQPVLEAHEITQSDLARAVGLSAAAACRLVKHGLLPARRAGEVRKRALDYLRGRGVSMAHLRNLVLPVLAAPTKEVGPAELHLGEAVPESPIADPAEPKEESMLLRNETLTTAAKRHFKLMRSPFVDDIQSRDDVFASQHGRYVRAALMDAATNHGFIAVVGESGSGKSTLREDLEERIREERKPIIVIKPYVLAMEPNDTRGKPMKAGQIAESIARTLAPNIQLKSSPDARYRQVHELLKASRAAGYSHLLMIEEAHRMPLPTLKHLKNFMELKDGLRRLLGVCLVGQPELQLLLSEQNPEVREIVQRCEQIVMEPLDNDLEGYLTHKLERAGARLADLFEGDALDAIRARLISMPRGGRASDAVSMCYPLVVNNLVCRALNAAAVVGFPKVDAEVIAGC
ncbi:ExeA family protein [Delftia sp. HK171]|uniref:ExeA family protein n=1 Tax=Delftia sp. HK171 TaxID=1920191 RepID=UPI001151DD99|nr:AAA family ATPase [Delftia sp. HK171]TQL73066.1 type II secretory pathway predicted ATPase ExeA [Delftia sp. HK171]